MIQAQSDWMESVHEQQRPSLSTDSQLDFCLYFNWATHKHYMPFPLQLLLYVQGVLSFWKTSLYLALLKLPLTLTSFNVPTKCSGSPQHDATAIMCHSLDGLFRVMFTANLFEFTPVFFTVSNQYCLCARCHCCGFTAVTCFIFQVCTELSSDVQS